MHQLILIKLAQEITSAREKSDSKFGLDSF